MNPKVGDIVKVFSSYWHHQCRAKITSPKIDGIYDVFLIDYGKTELVECDKIFELTEKLKEVCFYLHIRTLIYS